MQLKTAADFDPEVLRWFDKYVHGLIDRRGFLDGVARYAVGGVTATMLLDALNPRFAEAQQVAKDDSRISARFVDYAQRHEDVDRTGEDRRQRHQPQRAQNHGPARDPEQAR